MEEKKLSLGESVAGLDKAQLFSVGALFLLGVLSIFSAGAGFEGRGAGFATRQLLWGAVSIAAFLLTLKIGYEKFLREAYLLYGLSLLLLLSVMALGLTVKGSQRWIDLGFFRLQPTEFVKITLVLVLAKHLCRYPPLNFLSFLGGLAVPALSGILVLIQPDAGSAIVYGVISFVAIVVAGAPWRYPAGLLAIFTSLLPFAWRFLREYQKMRIRVFLDPWIDPLGAGYNVIQSRIAVGSGGLFGMGLGLGSPRNIPLYHSDFIFAALTEEFGLIFSVCVLVIYVLIIMRGMISAMNARTSYHSLGAFGIVAMLGLQTMLIVGGNTKLLPLTGVTLPLVSAGGSSLVSTFFAIGVLVGISSMNAQDEARDIELIELHEEAML